MTKTQPGWLKRFLFLFDTHALQSQPSASQTYPVPIRIDRLRAIPFLALHFLCGLVFYCGYSPFALGLCFGLYAVRMFAITAFYHRYFSHRAFKAGRLAQFCFAILGNSACQRGPLWWASHHRSHHRYADSPKDPHSPLYYPFWWSHFGWFLSSEFAGTKLENVRDWLRFPELRFLDRFDTLIPLLFLISLYCLGESVPASFHTSGIQCVVYGFIVSTVILFHATACINSLAHSEQGSRAYATKDNSRNHFLLALLTLGEGWHNNHHYFPTSSKQGFLWWQIDITYYGLKLLEKCRVVSDLRLIPDTEKEVAGCPAQTP